MKKQICLVVLLAIFTIVVPALAEQNNVLSRHGYEQIAKVADPSGPSGFEGGKTNTAVDKAVVNETNNTINETITNETQNITESNGTEAITNETTNETANGTVINETSNETITNETITNETSNETITNETITNETITNETITNETITNETITNETINESANETVINDTSNIIIIPNSSKSNTINESNTTEENTTEENVTETTTVNTTTSPNATTTPIPTETETPIPPEKEKIVINIVNNITVNLGITNIQIIDIKRDKDKKEDIRVRIKDLDTNEIIVVIIDPQGNGKTDISQTKFEEVENNFTGKHVSFQFTKNSITDYSVDGKLIFKSIDLGFTSTKVKKVGTELRISDNKNMVVLHDDDQGILTEKSNGNIESTYQVASGIIAKLSSNKRRVDFSDSIKASILTNDPDLDDVLQSISGNTIHVKIKDGGLSRFILSQINNPVDDKIVEAISLKRIGTIINIDSKDTHDITAFNVDTTINKVVDNTVGISLSSDTHDGKIIALNVNKDILKNLNLKTIIDGKVIPKAVDFDDLFKNDKLSYLIVIGQKVQILISIPEFSDHQVVVTSDEAEAATAIATSTSASQQTETLYGNTTGTATATPKIYGFSSWLVLIATVILYIFMRKKNKEL